MHQCHTLLQLLHVGDEHDEGDKTRQAFLTSIGTSTAVASLRPRGCRGGCCISERSSSDCCCCALPIADELSGAGSSGGSCSGVIIGSPLAMTSASSDIDRYVAAPALGRAHTFSLARPDRAPKKPHHWITVMELIRSIRIVSGAFLFLVVVVALTPLAIHATLSVIIAGLIAAALFGGTLVSDVSREDSVKFAVAADALMALFFWLLHAQLWPRFRSPTVPDVVTPSTVVTPSRKAPASQAATAEPTACAYSYCVVPGRKVRLTAANCAAHTRNLVSSMHRPASQRNAYDNLCVEHSPQHCAPCNGGCYPTASCPRHRSASTSELEREDRANPPDKLWQLSDAELLASWHARASS